MTQRVVLYNMASAGQRHTLKTRVRPWISRGKDRFDTPDQLFDCAAASECKPDDKDPRDSKSKGKQGSLRTAAIRNIIFDHPSPNLWETLPVIPIIPTIPVTQIRASPISPGEAAVPTYHQCRGFQRKSTKAERQTGNALAAAAVTTSPTFVANTASRVDLSRTPGITAAMTANKSNAKSHSTRSSKKTSLPLTISNSMGEAVRYGVRIGKLGKQSLICNLG